MFSNRRKSERKKTTNCYVTCVAKEWTSDGKVINISDSGMGLELEKVPKTKEELVLHVTFENGKKMKKKARVAWFINREPSESGAIVGVEFI